MIELEFGLCTVSEKYQMAIVCKSMRFVFPYGYNQSSNPCQNESLAHEFDTWSGSLGISVEGWAGTIGL